MPKRYHADRSQESRPHRPKHARVTRGSINSPDAATSPASGNMGGNDMSAVSDHHKQAAADRGADALARYKEVDLLFNSQFPGLAGASGGNGSGSGFRSQSSASPADLSPPLGHACNGFAFSDDDSYDPDHELAFELNASMGLVWRPTAQPLPDATTLPSLNSPWMSNNASGPMMPTASDTYSGIGAGGVPAGEAYPSHTSTWTDNYPFTSAAAGELMVTASSVDASYSRSPPRDSRAGEVVEGLGWLGDQLQKNARIQLQELNEGGSNMPYIS